MTSDLRKLNFERLEEAAVEAQSLLDSGYDRRGKWSLGQICQHLRLVQDPSVNGYPKWLSAFAFLRPVMRRLLLPRLMKGDSPKGIPTAPLFAPANDPDDAAEVAQLAESVRRFKSHPGDYAAHPAFGRMSREDLERVHAAHAAHHLRFLEPRHFIER
jgi:hypothetical protein